MKRELALAIIAGLLIGIGGSVFLACENKVVGAIFFSVALLCICMRGYFLFTGKVGFLVNAHGKTDIRGVLCALLGNLIGTVVSGYAIRYVFPAYAEKALSLCEAKLTQALPETLIRGIFCGMLMYLAVVIYKENKSISGIFFCVPVFILAGFEHSIANMFYFAASGIVSLRACLYLWIVILANAVGGMLIPALMLLCKEKKETST